MTAIRHLFVRAAQAIRQDLRGRRMIVTGAAPGSIGFATARALASWGADVVVTTRGDASALASCLRRSLPPGSGGVEALLLDLANVDSVNAFAESYARQHDHLDVLVNNAGIHLDLLSQWTAPRQLDGHEIHWRTNYLGTMQLTDAMLPLLLRSAARGRDVRIVNVVSMLHARGRNAYLFAPIQPYNSWIAYGTSKLALVHATFEWQSRHAADGLQAYCLHPGAVFSNIAEQGLSGNPRLQAVRRRFASFERFFLLTPDEGAQTTLYCATQPALEGGHYFRNAARAAASADANDRSARTRLWRETREWIEQRSVPAAAPA